VVKEGEAGGRYHMASHYFNAAGAHTRTVFWVPIGYPIYIPLSYPRSPPPYEIPIPQILLP